MKNITKKLAVTATSSMLLSFAVASQADAAVFISAGISAPVYPTPVMMAPTPVAYALPVAYAAPIVAPAPVLVGAYPAYYYGYGPHWH